MRKVWAPAKLDGNERVGRQENAQGAGFAPRGGLAAEIFADVDDEGVKFVEELVVGGEAAFEEGTEMFVGIAGGGQGVAFEEAAGVGVNDENGVAACIEEDGVGGFRADAVDREEFVAEFLCGSAKHAAE